ncbi:SemiSWEET transporter [Clostridium bowmanii]|uniref:SemiSWEET transporter n=1 Tax=Clostridium bowmanii TaxID=132925 RepID=UPI001C0AEC38|nr:SemiSWEET transporter [Clostridium bowmanii]MBU3189352.1 SemiSWEET transporter [Clostridium bowmanii]MCA1073968.1 SemiSWEET transporter [Clostridium bowmanii]
MITTIGFMAAAFTTLSFLPQAIKVIKTKNTSGISFSMYLMFTIGVFLWLVYGIYTRQASVALANAITLVFALIILKHTFDDLKKAKKA